MTENDNKPIDEYSIVVDKTALSGVGVIAGLDRGCTLTKVLYSTEANDDQVQLHFALFKNHQFENALAYLKHQGMIIQTPGAKLHVTGIGGDRHADVIHQIVGLESQFINELMTQSRGTLWLLTHLPESSICYPDPQIDDASVLSMSKNKFVQEVSAGWRCEMRQCRAAGKFPFLMLFLGSGGGMMKIEESGKTEFIGGVWLAGVTFLGLAKLLLGTDNYDEVMELAQQGSRNRIDLAVKDVAANAPNSAYGEFPDDVSIFSLGKLANPQFNVEQVNKADLARSLLYAFVNNAFKSMQLASRIAKTTKFVFAGNFFRHELARIEMKKLTILHGQDLIDVKFMRTGHTGALGAMVSEGGDLKEKMK